MRKLLSVMMIATASFALSGCTDFSSPQGVVGTAGNSLKKSDSETFFLTLTGKAQAKYGNSQGMIRLQSLLSGYDKIKSSKAKLLSETDSLETYAISIIGRKGRDSAQLLDAKVECKLSLEWISGHHAPCNSPYPVNDTLCGPGRWENVRSCRISDIIELK